jgi:tetratricopeptide (TPR) repeat protein
MNKKIECFIKIINELKSVQKNDSFGENVFVVDIPEKKLINAKKVMNVPENQTALILFDETVFGSAKDGTLFTDWGIYYKLYGFFWSFSWESLFKSDCTLDIRNEWPILYTSTNDQEIKKEILFPVSKPGNNIFLFIFSAGVNILGNPDEIEVNSTTELAEYVKSRHKKNNNNKEVTNEVPQENKKVNEVNVNQDTATPNTTTSKKIDIVAEKKNKKKYDNFIQYFKKGIDYGEKENYKQAIIWLSKAINEYNDEMNEPDQLALAHQMFATSRFLEFIENIEKYINDDEITDREAFFILINDIKKAIELNPKEALLYFHIGIIYYLLTLIKNDKKIQVYFNESLKYYDKAIELDQNDEQYKEKRKELIDENMDCYKKHILDNQANFFNKNVDSVINLTDKKEKTNEVSQDEKLIKTKNKQQKEQTTDKAEEMPDEKKAQSENKSVEIQPLQINKKIILVCDKTGGNIDAAESLLKLIKQSCAEEPELRTYAEYKTISFEAELLGEEQDFLTIFFLTPASPSMINVAWKYNKDGIRYGWNVKKAVIFAENGAYNKEENKNILVKYGGKNIQEAFARMFYHEEILKFLSEEA